MSNKKAGPVLRNYNVMKAMVTGAWRDSKTNIPGSCRGNFYQKILEGIFLDSMQI